MALYDRLYDRTGKGVDADEPEKQGFLLFFDILIHKFSKFLIMNFLYTALSFLWIVVLILLGRVILNTTNLLDNITNAVISLDPSGNAETVRSGTALLFQMFFGIGFFVLWGSGPASAAYAYIIRCFAHRLPVFVISDGFDKIKENFKQGIFILIIDLVVIIGALNAVGFYYNYYLQTKSIMWLVLTYLMIIAIVIYTMMHPYLYQIMVTFKLSTKNVYKNALFLAFAKLPGNFLMLVLNILVLLLPFSVLTPFMASVIMLLLGLCLSRYPSEFYASRVIDKLMIENNE